MPDDGYVPSEPESSAGSFCQSGSEPVALSFGGAEPSSAVSCSEPESVSRAFPESVRREYPELLSGEGTYRVLDGVLPA